MQHSTKQSHLCSLMSEQPVELSVVKFGTLEYDIIALRYSK